MNIFEDLVEELKEENLLEETVITKPKKEKESPSEDSAAEVQSDKIESSNETRLSGEQDSESALSGADTIAEEPVLEVEDSNAVAETSTGKTPEIDASSGSDRGAYSVAANEDMVSESGGQVELEVTHGDEATENHSDLNVENSDNETLLAEPEEDDRAQDIEATAEIVEPIDESEVGLKDGESGGDAKSDVVVDTDSKDEADPEIIDEVEDERDEKEIYRQRLVDEIATLEIVEHTFSGVEREQLRTAPDPYYVVPVKQALQIFLAEFEKLETIEQTEAETNLRKEIEQWHSALLERDKKIPTSHLRRYSNDNKLDSKSYVALARFYRNSHFSEGVRSKFDFVVTGLFSNRMENNRRVLVLERDEIIKSINELYAEWNSIPVYSVEDEDSELVLAAFGFQDFINEVEKCKNFDRLITSGFFKRITAFKKKIGENFFAPLVIASAVECNFSIGNRYADLIALERTKEESKKLAGKDGSTGKKAASKTNKLVELLNDHKAEQKGSPQVNHSAAKDSGSVTSDAASGGYKRTILGLLLVVGLIGAGYFIYSPFYGGTPELTASEKKVKLERSFLHEFVKSAKIKDNTFSGDVTAAWDNLSADKKKEIVGKIYKVGRAKGYSKVELKGKTGSVVAVTNGTKVEISE